jgi:hypothetical protein
MANKKGLMKLSGLILTVGFLLSGCATRIGDFTLMSSKNVELSRMGEFTYSKKAVKGTDSIVTLLFFMPVKKDVDMREAIDKALAKIPGAVALVDVRIYYHKLNFILFQVEGFTISGNALIDPKYTAAGSEVESRYLAIDTNDGINFTEHYITEEEYDRYLASVK